MRFVLALFVAVAVSSFGAQAAEEILRFHSDVQIAEDGTLSVTETIRVRAEGNQIRRGIFRDFPTRYRQEDGLFKTVGFKVLSVTRDGVEEPWFTDGMPGGVRVYIGDKNFMLPWDEYTYELKYETTRQLRFFNDYDELYWNVTGNDWSFPIREAVARVVVPEGATFGQRAAYTGSVGSTEQAVESEVIGERTIEFQATRTLRPREGLTIAVSWQKGIVPEPSGGVLAMVRDNLGLALSGGGLLAILAYFLTFWTKVGRDPPAGVVFPRFKPPQGLSPAAVGYIFYRGFSSRMKGTPRAFVAALMSLATKGVIRIEDRDDTIAIKRNGMLPDEAPVGETAIYNTAFGGYEEMVFDKGNGPLLKTMVSRFTKAILKEYGSRFFNDNLGLFIVGLILSAAIGAGSIALYLPTEEEMGGLIATVIGAVLVGFVLYHAILRISGEMPGGRVWLGWVLIVLGLPLAGGLALSFFIPLPWPYEVLRAVLAMLVLINFAFFYLLRAPTAQGQAVMSEIDGFRMYLSVAEAERMNMKDAPDFNTDLFERFLPYAIALGVEKPWSETLERHLKATGQEAQYRPRYYSGRSWNSGAIAASTAAMASTMGSSIASAMPQPKSSGGSGGGGFSGGGGGGGGGGGW